MGFRMGRVALLVAMRSGTRLPVSMSSTAGAVVGGGRRSGDVGGEGGALGGDLLGGGGPGEQGPDDGEGEAERDGDADLGAKAQRRAPPPAAQEPRGGVAPVRAARHRHPAPGGCS
jgi:hypothetical protein